ncbi:MAG: aspartate aminotransferase family protein [Isosphaeraceae bacterium]
MSATALPDLIADAQTTEERFLRQIFVRDQMAEWSKQPLIMARAEGVHYWDVHGKHYLDALSGIYVVSVGHNNPRVIEAVTRQMQTLCFSPPMHGTNPLAVRLANRLAELAPGDLSAVKLQTGGSEVTEAAIKLRGSITEADGIARQVQDHQPIPFLARLDPGLALGLGAEGPAHRERAARPRISPRLPAHLLPLPLRQDVPRLRNHLRALIGDTIEMEDPETVAAIMVEPIGHTGGVIDPPEEYLPLLREICDRYNVLLIFDEIITGIGRTGHLFAAETFGVTPDVLCVAKGLSGGIAPVSAMICRRSIADAFWGPIAENPGFVEGHTFEGNPISCAAALAVLDEIQTHDLCGNARARGAQLRTRFEELQRKYPVIGDIRGKGLFQAIELVRDPQTRARFSAGSELGVKVGRRALEHGLLCRFDPHWIAFGPPLVSTEAEIDAMVGVLDRSLGEVLDEAGIGGSAS